MAAPSQPVVSDACCAPGTELNYVSKGTETNLHGLPTYVMGTGSNAVIFVTDIFGWQYSNSRHLADLIAGSGPFTVLMPDILGDPIKVETAVKYGKLAVMPWMLLHSPSSTVPKVEDFAKAVRQEGKYTKIFAIGFCYGATHVAEMLTNGTADAGVITHSTETDTKYAKSISRPLQMNCAENDEFFPEDKRKEWEKIFTERGAPVDMIVYPGVEHGFATRSNGRGWSKGDNEGADANTELQQKKVHENICAFLNKQAAA